MCRSPSPPCCFILPSDILARIAEEGTPEQRRAALNTLAASASFRARRSITRTLVRDLNMDVRSLTFVAPPEGEKRTVYDAGRDGQSALPGTKVRGEGDPPGDDDAANQAFDGAGTTYDFFHEVLGRDSVDDRGLELVSSVHYGVQFENAFWNGGQMVYGDGGGQLFEEGSLTKALDVIGHELTHGVTQFTAGLEYSKQSGALNESMSDVFGSLVKQRSLGQTAEGADWLIGADTLHPSLGTALRSMKDPGTANQFDSQPGHMRDYVDLPDNNDPRNDNGGVHINSGIPNKAFHLAATALGGHAWEKAGPIWYAALTGSLGPTSDFAAAAQATVEAAGHKFSATEQNAVRSAWQEVGVL
jgi:Zn-dependent metalloprotease